MENNLIQKLITYITPIWKFLWRNTFGKIVLLLTILTGLQTLGILNLLISSLINVLISITLTLSVLYFGIPVFYWFIITITLVGLLYWVSGLSRYIKLVSGEFRDDFKDGLGKWNFGNEGWLVEKEKNETILSVMSSDLGGITQAGLWDSFSFSFENKLLGKGKIGWIVKARDRSNYMMLQLAIVDSEGTGSEKGLKKGIYIRPHFRYEGSWVIWPHEPLALSDSLEKIIRRYNWFKVDVQVRGNTIDLYLEGEHVYHLYLDDPLRVEKIENLEHYDEQGKKVGSMQIKKLNVFSYSQGRVGFRCAPTEEHAHIRKVKIKPIW